MKKYTVNQDILSADLKIDYFDGLTKDQIIKMANNPLHTIGSHTVTHPDLTKLSVTAETLTARQRFFCRDWFRRSAH